MKLEEFLIEAPKCIKQEDMREIITVGMKTNYWTGDFDAVLSENSMLKQQVADYRNKCAELIKAMTTIREEKKAPHGSEFLFEKIQEKFSK